MITPEILQQRKCGIGGSDVAAILGVSKYKTATDIFLEKTSSEIPNQEENNFIHWGNKLEAVIADEYSQVTGFVLEEPKEMFHHLDKAFLIANPDRLIIGQNAILECKTCSVYRSSEFGAEGSDDIPIEYLLQIAHYRYVMNADYVALAVLIGGNEFKTYRYERNKVLEDKMMEKLECFWVDNVLKGVPPAPTTRKDVEKIFECREKKVIVADDELHTNIISINQIKEKIAALSDDVEALQNKVCSKILDATDVVDGHGEKICTYRPVTINRFQPSEFRKDNPTMYERYKKPVESRVFRVCAA